MNSIPELLVTAGPLAGRRFEVSDVGLRLGRSSSCEISVADDPALSRNHCLFEKRDGRLWVTDLASANGTAVNDVMLGADPVAIEPGARIVAGDTTIVAVAPGADAAPAPAAPAPAAAEGAAPVPKVDLGLGKPADSETGSRLNPVRIVLWVAAVLAVVASAMLILSPQEEGTAAPRGSRDVAEEKPTLHSLSFEKVEADGEHIYRCALACDAKGVMSVVIDDVPKENRHVKKSAELSAAAREELEKIIADEALYRLEREYTGVPLHAGTLRSCSLRIVRGSRVFETAFENALEPEEFKTVRERLETFFKNELGVWAVQYSADQLKEKSAESRRAGDSKWEERDVQYGNLAAALGSYEEAVYYLETVNPKPDDYGELVARRDEAKRELDRRYRDQRFLADRAINLGDWPAAQRELRILCDMVPDAKDPRHAEANGRLVDVEARMKKGDRK